MTIDRDAIVEAMARAMETAECKGREGPFGGYDYGHNTDFYGPAPEGGRYVIRDFRDPSSPGWGAWLHQTDDSDEHNRVFNQMTEYHIARAALAVALPWAARKAGDVLMGTLACSICGEVDHCKCNFDMAVAAGPCQPSTDKQALAIRARFDELAKEIGGSNEQA